MPKLECQWFDIQLKWYRFVPGNIYRPPQTLDTWWGLLQESIDKALGFIPGNKVLITSDPDNTNQKKLIQYYKFSRNRPFQTV